MRMRMAWWLGALLLAMVRPVLANETVTYYLTDAQGTVLMTEDANGATTATYDYRPYGASEGVPAPTGPGYTGHVNDPGTGLVYMQQRYYDPQLGLFLSVDPVMTYGDNLLHFNRYAYVYNNPYKFTDPDGRSGVALLGGVITESWNALNGRGFDGAMVVGALQDGYNGEGDGVIGAVIEDGLAITTVVGGIGALKALTSIAARQTGKRVAQETVRVLSKSERKSVRSYEKRIAEHQKKLAEYKRDPDKLDHQGRLDGASPEVRQSVIEGRIKHLKDEIKNFQKSIDNIKNGK